MPKLPLLARLILSAMRANSSLRAELRQTNLHLAGIASALRDANRLRRMELNLPADDGDPVLVPERAADSGLSPDPRFDTNSEFQRFALAEDEAQKFRERYFREPTDEELVTLVQAAQYGGERGGTQAPAPQRPPADRQPRQPADLSAIPAEGA